MGRPLATSRIVGVVSFVRTKGASNTYTRYTRMKVTMNIQNRWCRWCGEPTVVIGAMTCAAKECYNYDLADSLGILPEAFQEFITNPPFSSTMTIGNLTKIDTYIQIADTNTTWANLPDVSLLPNGTYSLSFQNGS